MRKGKLVTIFLVVVMVLTTVAFCFAACNNDKDEKEVVLRILENDTAKKKDISRNCWTHSMQSMQAKE